MSIAFHSSGELNGSCSGGRRNGGGRSKMKLYPNLMMLLTQCDSVIFLHASWNWRSCPPTNPTPLHRFHALVASCLARCRTFSYACRQTCFHPTCNPTYCVRICVLTFPWITTCTTASPWIDRLFLTFPCQSGQVSCSYPLEVRISCGSSELGPRRLF